MYHPADATARNAYASRPPEIAPLFAALDLGTNNCRFMVARPERQRLKVVDSFSQIVRLGEGVSQTGKLSDEAMERTFAALEICASRLKNHVIEESHFVATDACRRAENGAAFIARIREELGLNLTIISEKDEAVLAFLGCSPLLNSATDYALMLDIGGGSTELLLVDMRDAISPRIVGWQSFPIGVMNISENKSATHLSAVDYNRLVLRLSEHFSGFVQQYELNDIARSTHLQMICCSGTVTTLGAINKNLPRYDRREVDGMTLSMPELHHVIEKVVHMPVNQRQLHPCIGEDRVDFLIAGCSILQAACRVVPVPTITVADRGVREGILLSLFQRHIPA